MNDALKDIESGKNATETIEKILSLPPDQQQQFIERISRLKTTNAAQFLTLLVEKTADKKLQKAIKKGLFRLKTQGIQVEEPRTTGESVLRKTETVREAQAYLSNYDAEETRVALVAFEVKKNQFVFSHAISRFSTGLVELATLPVTRDQLDTLLKDYLWRAQPPVVLAPVSPPYCGYVIEEAAALAAKNVEEARGIKRFLNDMKGDVRKPQDIYNLQTEDGVRSLPLQAILAHPIFEPFLLTWTGSDEDQKKLNEAINPSIVLPPYVVEERREAFLKELIDSEKLRAKTSFLKRMLEDYAYLFYCTREFSHYRGLVDGLKDGTAIPAALLSLARKSLEKIEKKAQEQPGLIVDPYAAPKK